MKVTVIPIVIGALSTVTKGSGGLGLKGTSGDHLNNNIIKTGPSTKKSPGSFLSNSSEKPSANAGVKNSQMEHIERHEKIGLYIHLRHGKN